MLDRAKTKRHVIHIKWIYVGIPGNEMADITAKDAMQNGIEDKTKPAKSEIYTVIHKAIMYKWQQYWGHPQNGIYSGIAYHHVNPKVKKRTQLCTAPIGFMIKSTQDLE